jgi:omega-6 fatty acid desaturase (delta-12 desaturase)
MEFQREFMTATTNRFGSPSAAAPAAAIDFTIKDILKTLPKESFQKDRRKAWSSVLLSVVAAAVGYGAIAVAPWFLLPFAWFFTGTALTGWFVIAHDCGHRSFAKRRWVNDWVGHLMMLPLLYPFHCWRLLHDFHHVHTNELSVDNAWQPWTISEFDNTPPVLANSYKWLRGRLWWMASIAHWAGLHFDLNNFSAKNRGKARVSIVAVLLFAAVLFPTLMLTLGVWGVVKFWLFPWLVYHFWMSTFTLVHHTDLGIPFRPTAEWNAAEAQLAGTVHCSYPRWVEILCHDINVHIPHHISVAVPSYRLRQAHRSLLVHWGDHMQMRRFSWGLMKEIVDYCHLHDPEANYTSFKAARR